MTDVFGISELSMLNDMRQLDMISHNIANATTSGFKRDIPVSRSFAAQFDTGVETVSRLLAGADASVPTLSSVVDFTQGALRNTGNPLDVALEGEGFFEFNDGNRLVYSRQGNFRLDGSGRLLSAAGLVVNGQGGEIRLTADSPRIDNRGKIWDGEDAIAQLKVVRFTDPTQLAKLGNGSFQAGSGARTETLFSPSLRQGFLETSNIEVMDEMVRMMTTVRHFEATQHVIQSYDDMLGTAIQTIAEF